MAQYQDMRELSMELNRAFDDSMYSEYARQIQYTVHPICEVLRDANFKIVGSRAEGTHSIAADVDLLMIDQTGVKVGYDPQEAGTEFGMPYLRLVRGSLTPAGYTKFQIYLNGNNCENIESNTLQKFFDYEIERYNAHYILLTNRKPTKIFHEVDMTVHGPARTINFTNDKSFDQVFAYESKHIPIDMNSWFERTRLKRWPSKTTCELFKSMGCCYVAVGHSKSHEKYLEWRISPTKQELYLMLNLNPTQFRCYIYLKLIKRTLHRHCDNGISSYHCKTALFWTIENTDSDIWQPDNLVYCFLECVKLLLFWVTHNNCPNYFIPEENMFETQVINEHHCNYLQTVIANYYQICSMLLSAIKSSKTLNAYINTGTLLKSGLSVYENDSSPITQQTYTFHQYIHLIKPETRNACIKEFQDRVSPHTINIDMLFEMLEEKLLRLKRYDHLEFVRNSITFTEKDITAHIIDIQRKSHHDNEYCLKLASIVYARGKHSTCDVILQYLYSMAMFNIYCECYMSFQLDKTQQKRKGILDGLTRGNIYENIRLTGQFKRQLTISDLIQRLSYCLLFRDEENEAGVVMPPLNFDAHKLVGIPSEKIHVGIKGLNKYGEDPISIHPAAYMHFLQYKTSAIMNKKCDMCVALEKLEHMNLISLQKGIYPHPDTTINILGHIFSTKGWQRLAVQCFKRSWQIEPYYNAVKWHVMFMLLCNLRISENNS